MKKKILVVDDEPYIQASLRMYLEMEGFEIITAGNGAEAFEKISQLPPDLILLDVMMPEMDGYEFARRLRAGNHAKIPVIAITALAQDRDVARAREAGIDGHISKPYAFEELINQIRLHLESAEKSA